MIKRTIEISSAGSYLHIEQDNLVIEREGTEVGRVPCEDIGLLILDTPRLSITQSAMNACAQSGAAIVVCGPDHHPNAIQLPLAGNVLHAQRIRAQADAKKPVQKRLWQQVVQAKLRVQAQFLPKAHPNRNRIMEVAKVVKSGDTGNAEAFGAKLYWAALFEDIKFRRARDGEPPNNLLNYGYMVLRATVARALCGAGLHPALGIHHSHRENPFALADDLMEPYRPFFDSRVRTLWDMGKREIDRECKEALLGALSAPIYVEGHRGPLMVGIQRSAASLYQCLAGESDRLALPGR